MAKYFSVKCSYVNSQFYHRKQTAHDHNTQAQFVVDAKAAAATLWSVGTDDITTTQIQSNISDPHVNSEEI